MKAGAWFALLASGAVAAPAPARADTRIGFGITIGSGPRDYRGDYSRGGYRGAYAYGFDRGVRDGAEEGQSDGRHRRDLDFWREGDFRKGTSGYKGWMGPRWEYADGYRRGYEQGYRRSYAASWRGYRGDYDYGRYRYDDRYRDDRYRYDDRYYREGNR